MSILSPHRERDVHHDARDVMPRTDTSRPSRRGDSNREASAGGGHVRLQRSQLRCELPQKVQKIKINERDPRARKMKTQCSTHPAAHDRHPTVMAMQQNWACVWETHAAKKMATPGPRVRLRGFEAISFVLLETSPTHAHRPAKPQPSSSLHSKTD